MLQGSILGPLLFGVYMNYLPMVVGNCNLCLYVDDICSNVNLSCAENDLQEDLNLVYSWLCINLLSLSVKKSNVMLVGSRQKLQNHDLNITIDCWPISHVSSFKYSGLYVDENVTLQDHTMSVLQRVLCKIHCLYRLNPVPDNFLGKLYRVFVLTIIDE